MKFLPISEANKDEPIWAWLNESGIRLVRWSSAEEAAEDDNNGNPDAYWACWVDVSNKSEWWIPKWFLPFDAIEIPEDSLTFSTRYALKEILEKKENNNGESVETL